MEIFLDSANLNEIKMANELGVISGITTNPTSMAKEIKETGMDFNNIIAGIADLVYGPISVETMQTTIEAIVTDARNLSKISDKIVVKIPLTFEGLKAVRILNHKIKTNLTLTFSANQTLLAAKAGADFVSIFIGRLDDIGEEGMQVVRDTVNMFNNYDIDTKIIAASIRSPLHVIEAAKAGSDVCTVSYNILEKMIRHPLTDIGIERFLKDWEMTKE